MFYDMLSRVRMNMELQEKERETPFLDRAEKKALRQAEKAEEAFRESKGYPPATLRAKVKYKLKKWLET